MLRGTGSDNGGRERGREDRRRVGAKCKRDWGTVSRVSLGRVCVSELGLCGQCRGDEAVHQRQSLAAMQLSPVHPVPDQRRELTDRPIKRHFGSAAEGIGVRFRLDNTTRDFLCEIDHVFLPIFEEFSCCASPAQSTASC